VFILFVCWNEITHLPLKFFSLSTAVIHDTSSSLIAINGQAGWAKGFMNRTKRR